MPRRVKEVVKGVARAMGTTAEIVYEREQNPVVNDAKMAEFMREVSRDVLGSRSVDPDAEPSMAGEDHAAYQEMVPGCYVFFGSAPRRGEVFAHHHPRFNPSEDVLEPAVRVMAEAARRWLERS